MVWKVKVDRATALQEPFFTIFLPSFLCLISMGFFLRIGWILASSSLFTAATLIILSVAISALTALSISTTASNLKIENGSLYYLLSRTFGLDAGSAISLPLFAAQILSSSFYLIGIKEMILLVMPFAQETFVSLFLFTLLAAASFLSSQVIQKAQLVFFILLSLGLASFYLGQPVITPSLPPITISNSFWVLFSIFFPVVTGIEGSLTFISHLKKPHISIPLGLFLALSSSLLIYLSIAYLLTQKAPMELLAQDPLIVTHLSLIPSLTFAAIIVTAFSGALTSVFSASATLASLAEDKILPFFCRKRLPSLVISLLFAFSALFLKSLNFIAPLVTLFFLISYGMLNAATSLEALIENPSWRPSLKTPWVLPAIGAFLCFFSLLMINAALGLISLSMIFALYFMIRRRRLHSSWEDMRYSILLFLSRIFIYKLNLLNPSPKTWRPNLLVFLGDPLLRSHLTSLSCDLTHKKGFLIFSSIFDIPQQPSQDLEEKKLHFFLEKTSIPALVKTKFSTDLFSGMQSLIEDIGLGALSPNTIVLGASEKQEKVSLFSDVIRFVYRNKKNLILIRENGLRERLQRKEKLHQKRNIEVWWGGKNKENSELMLVLSYMLQTSDAWKGSYLTLKTLATSDQDVLEIQKALDAFILSSRLPIQGEVIPHVSGEIFSTTMKESSKQADLIFLGLRPPEETETTDSYGLYYHSLIQKTAGFPPIAYVLSGENLEFKKILT